MSQVIDSLAYSLRPIGEADMPMLREIYYASRAEEMKFFPLAEDQKQQWRERAKEVIEMVKEGLVK